MGFGKTIKNISPFISSPALCGKEKPLFTIGERSKWYSHYADSVEIPKMLAIDLPYDAVILLVYT